MYFFRVQSTHSAQYIRITSLYKPNTRLISVSLTLIFHTAGSVFHSTLKVECTESVAYSKDIFLQSCRTGSEPLAIHLGITTYSVLSLHKGLHKSKSTSPPYPSACQRTTCSKAFVSWLISTNDRAGQHHNFRRVFLFYFLAKRNGFQNLLKDLD